jgi:hypothetical protein
MVGMAWQLHTTRQKLEKKKKKKKKKKKVT